MSVSEPDDPDQDTDARRALRAQLLATEHWSLLASRSTTQSEILTRIAIFLTLVSAGLVTLGILRQVTGPEQSLAGITSAVLAFQLLVGVLTQVRVINAMNEDLMYVAAMNRLRGAYLDLAPEIARYFMASPNDDEAGVGRTYYFFGTRDRSQVLGSSGMFIGVINSVLVGVLASVLATMVGAATPAAAALGVVVALAAVAANVLIGYRSYRRAWGTHQPMRRTPS